MSVSKAEREQLTKHRKDHFAAEVEAVLHPICEGEFALRTTTNGFQWMSISLLPDEARQVIKLLEEYLRNNHDNHIHYGGKACPVCGKGRIFTRRHSYDGVNGLYHSICDTCKAIITTPEQSRYNKKKLKKR
jgi:hypothetical protein